MRHFYHEQYFYIHILNGKLEPQIVNVGQLKQQKCPKRLLIFSCIGLNYQSDKYSALTWRKEDGDGWGTCLGCSENTIVSLL